MPLIDTGERERLSFWRRHAVAIQSDLLEITGWLNHATERDLLTRTEAGDVSVPPGSRPSNVLFLVPREGTRAYQNWEWCLGYLRTEQNRRRLVQQHVNEAQKRLEAADVKTDNLRLEFLAVRTRLEDLADRSRKGVARGSHPSPNGPLTHLRSGMGEARATLSAFRAAERHRETIRLQLDGLNDHLVPRVYPGLWARVNAFLDLQALSVASVASGEFRKVPRPLAGLAARLERELEAD
ncbi:MAG: hypothetical protein ACYDDZ_06630 [Acidimicrobiales bacterium]